MTMGLDDARASLCTSVAEGRRRRSSRRRRAVFVALGLGLLATSAAAHIRLDFPSPRTSSQKFGPCGVTGSERGGDITVFRAGETITVRWTETIDHPSHYRIAFDPDGHDGFVDPPEMMDAYSNELVLLDLIADRTGGGAYEAEITLPDVACDRCTLQLIQVMYDKPPYTVPGNDIYYQCADLVLVRDEVDAGVTDGGVAGADGGVADADAGARDAGPPPDAGDDDHDHGATGGCACRATPNAAASVPWSIALGALLVRRARKR